MPIIKDLNTSSESEKYSKYRCMKCGSIDIYFDHLNGMWRCKGSSNCLNDPHPNIVPEDIYVNRVNHFTEG